MDDDDDDAGCISIPSRSVGLSVSPGKGGRKGGREGRPEEGPGKEGTTKAICRQTPCSLRRRSHRH